MKPVRADPLVQGGLPCLAGTRVPTRTIWRFWRAGYAIEAILQEYPALSHEQVWDAILFERRRHPLALCFPLRM